MNAQRVMERLGYRPAEARIYVALVESGETTISKLAQKTGIPRTTTQGILNDLRSRGLASHYTMRRRKLWCAESPKTLLAQYQELKSELTTAVGTLERARDNRRSAAQTLHMQDVGGVRFVLSDILGAKQDIFLVGPVEKLVETLGQGEIEHFLRQCEALGITTRTLSAEMTPTLTAAAQSRYLPSLSSGSALLILYGEKVAAITFEKPVSAVVIDSAPTHTLLVRMCEHLWELGEE